MDAETLVRPVVERAGMELVEVALRRIGGRRVLQVTVDGDDVDLDAIAALSQKVSRRLDLEGFGQGPYELQVGSAGIEHPLRTSGQYRRAVGQTVSVTTAIPIEGSTTLTGTLVEVQQEAIVVATSGGERRIFLSDVSSARTVVDWDAELGRSAR